MKPQFAVALGFCWFAVVCPFDVWAKDTKMQELTIKQLIDGLANKNPPPPFSDKGGPPLVTFPRNYDWTEQARVLSVWQQLNDRAEEALPELVAHLDDKKYCVSYEVGYCVANALV